MNETSDECDKNTLEKELAEIGIRNIENYNISYLKYSPKNKGKNKELYKIANDYLLETIEKNDSGKFIHVTGEMKALADPNHRNCIKQLYEQNKQQFVILFSLPEGYDLCGYDIKKYNIEQWADANWMDHLASFDILGADQAMLFNNYIRQNTQFSLFGDELVLFQSNHETGAHEKKVWLFESKSLFKKLENYAEEIIKNSTYIRPRMFFQFNLSLSSIPALNILFYLKNKGLIPLEEVKKEIKNLILMGFIQKVENSYQITNDGHSFLNLFA